MTTTTTKSATKVLVLTAKTIKGTSFIGINDYANSKGEVSNQTLLAGFSYEKALEKDFESLKENGSNVLKDLINEFSETVILKAYCELFNSLEKRLSSPEVKEALRLENDATIKRSDSQIDAFVHLAKGIKLCLQTNEIHIFGLVVRKKVLKAIENKEVKSRELTLCKNAIQKYCKFRQLKYRTFIFKKAEVKIKGITI